jgi:hypothetical protein
MRLLAIVVALVGLAGMVIGVMFVIQAGSAETEIANSIAPLTFDQVNPKYDKVAASYTPIMQAEEPKIQAGQAAPSVMYDYLSAQRALLGLAKSNIGVASFVRMSGYVNIAMGLGLLLAGLLLMRKNKVVAEV